MNSKKKGNRIASAISILVGAASALVLGAVFYGAMAYQLADGGAQTAAQQAQTDGVLALAGAELVSEQTASARYGGADCEEVVRLYRLESGEEAEAITAQPAAYIERLSEEGYAPQLITGYVLAGMEAVYAVRGEEALLCARTEENIYMIRARADETAVYALGAAAYLE